MAKLKIHKNKYFKKKEQIEKQKELHKFYKEIMIPFLMGLFLLICFITFCTTNIINLKNTYLKVGNVSISKVEFNYYKKYVIDTWAKANEEEIEEKELDLKKDLIKQKYNEKWTWDDFFDYQTANLIQQTKIFVNQAKKENYTLKDDSQYKETKEALQDLAENQHMEFNAYLKEEFGEKATEKMISDIIKEQFLSINFYEDNKNKTELTDEELDNYYYANAYDFDSVDYRYFIFNEADYSNAKTLADEFESQIEDENSFKELCKKYSQDEKYEDNVYSKAINVTRNQLSEEYQNFLFSSRETGDTSVIYDEDIEAFVVLYFVDRYLDDYDVYSFRQLYLKDDSEHSMDEINELWEKTNKTEDDFIKLVKEYSEDDDTKESGGLYEDKEYGSTNSEINDWLYRQNRKVGDYGVVKLNKGSSLIYVSKVQEAKWKEQARNSYETSTFEEWLEEQKKIYEITDPNNNFNFM